MARRLGHGRSSFLTPWASYPATSLSEILTVIPRVCKSWKREVSDPYFWQEIDVYEWSKDIWHKRCDPEQLDEEQLDRMLRMLIEHSRGSFRRLSVFGLRTESMFTFVADHAGSLEMLEPPRSNISDSIVEFIALRLSSLTYLDLSECTEIGARAIESFGKHCRSLVVLRRTMDSSDIIADAICSQREAFAIAKMMTKLRHLEMSYLLPTIRGVLEILSKCRDLEYLDLRGCWNVKLDEKYFQEQHSGVKVLAPEIVDYSSDSSAYSWMSISEEEEPPSS